jgi:hypothetical protein
VTNAYVEQQIHGELPYLPVFEVLEEQLRGKPLFHSIATITFDPCKDESSIFRTKKPGQAERILLGGWGMNVSNDAQT